MKPPTKLSTGNPCRFIHTIATDKERIEESVSNLRIDSDGDVAQVWFDYSFVSGGHKENRAGKAGKWYIQPRCGSLIKSATN